MIAFKLDPKSGVPFYRQIVDQIRFGIGSAQLEVGEQLPTMRALAVELQVNLNTVTKAYKELEIRNILETQQGTGTFISNLKIDISEKEREEKLDAICTEFINIATAYGFKPDDVMQQIKRKTKG